MNTVTTPLNKPGEQQFIQTGVSLESFKAIQQGFDGVISLHYLEPDGYQKISHSRLLPDLDVKLLTLCAAISSRRQAVQDFRGEGDGRNFDPTCFMKHLRTVPETFPYA